MLHIWSEMLNFWERANRFSSVITAQSTIVGGRRTGKVGEGVKGGRGWEWDEGLLGVVEKGGQAQQQALEQ